MDLVSRIFRNDFFIKLRNWEYWPFGIIQAPLFPYWLWLSLKARSLVFFSASNPGILMGGMFGESKFDVLEKVPSFCKPKTLLVRTPVSPEEVLRLIRDKKMNFPLIFKPDLGERGLLVKKIRNEQDLDLYLKTIRMDFLIQDLVDLPLEFGVFYVRYPNESKGTVTSIVGKEMLQVIGDGKKSLMKLILDNDRAKLQWKILRDVYAGRLQEILQEGKKMELISIGNHCLGTKFLNSNHLITEKLSESFDAISKQIEGFYFGRFDLRTASADDLENGKVMVMELNGCGAEPAHIYQPGFPLFRAMRILFRHWHDIYRISAENNKRGVAYISFREARSIYKYFKAATAQ